MFGRIFGRGKDDPDQAVCAECGRTLLAGEWTQTVVDADGNERLICSLCGQTRFPGDEEFRAAAPTPANSGRVRESRTEATRDPHSESDAFWRALKEKEAEIEQLQAQLARAEAEKQELAGRFAHLGAQDAGVAGGAVYGAVAEPTLGGDSSEPGERTWGETPAEFAAELAAIREQPVAPEPEAALEPVAEPALEPVAELATEQQPVPPEAASEAASSPAGAFAPDTDVPAIVFEDTQPIPALSDEQLEAVGQPAAQVPAAELPGDPEDTLTPEPDPAAVIPEPAGIEQAPAAAAAAEPDSRAADPETEAASLTLLQRGVDLLNVSRVPRKIAETNEQLGLPSVHVGFDDQAVAATFMWSMGWYRYDVDIESGDVRMADRGYEELTDLRPNAGVRADGTVQLAPAQISRAAAAQRPPAPAPEGQPQATAQPAQPAEPPESPSAAAQKPPEILSKSLLGQRSDDEAASWEQTQARDFDWDR